jgi:membrane protein YdbS with pleckstrin-like domain
MQKNIHFYLVRAWFLSNAVIALLPNIYWAADQYQAAILGMPATLFYFLFVSLSITGSILYAYWSESASGDEA